MQTIQYRTALITGASAGIGTAFARQLAASGANLILVARRGDRLQILADELQRQYPVRVEFLTADLASKDDLQNVESCIAGHPTLDLLINNAGFGSPGDFSGMPRETALNMLAVHVTASVRLCRTVLPGMLSRHQGGLINVASVAAFLPIRNVMYSSTKAFLVTFSQALQTELYGTGIRVQALCPGFTYSEFHDVIHMDRGSIPGFLWGSAEQVVDTSLKALPRGQVICVPGWKYKLFTALLREPLIATFIRTVAMQIRISH